MEDCEAEVFMFAFDVRRVQPSNAERAWPDLYRSAWRRSDSVAEHTNHLAINFRRKFEFVLLTAPFKKKSIGE